MEDTTAGKVGSFNTTPLSPPKLGGDEPKFRGGTDLRQSPAYGKYIESLGWVVIGDNPQIFIRKLGLFGAIAKIQRFKDLNWESTREILKKHHVWMTKLEPLAPVRFRQDSWPMLATKTLRIDLTSSLEKIFNQFKKDCKYILRKANSKEFIVHSNEFENFYSVWRLSAKIKKLWIPSKKDYDSLVKIFGKNCFCITINNLSGALVLIHDGVAYYYYSGSLLEGKKQNLPYLVIWECIKEAKRRRCKVWDFEGIYDDRWPNRGWLGFSHFKRSFGGYEVAFPGSFTKWF